MLAVRPDSTRGAAVRQAALDLVGSFQNVVLSPVTTYLDMRRTVAEWQQILQGNRQVSLELSRLRYLSNRLGELEQENRRLRELLNMPLDPQLRTLAARVVGDASSAFARSFILNIGQDAGVVMDAVVFVPAGLVGRVVRVGTHTSLVLTLLDLNSRIPVLAQRSREKGMAAGSNDRLLNLEYVAKDADIKVGDRVITSGIGSGLPKGLLVGDVRRVAPGDSSLFLEVLVQPAVNFDKIEEVRLFIPPDWGRNQVAPGHFTSPEMP